MRAPLTILILFLTLNWTNAQSVIPSKSSFGMHKRLILEIEAGKKEYPCGEDIVVDFKITNTSDTIQRILFKEYWPHIMGLTVSILDSELGSICKYPTKAVLSSQLFTEEELSDYHKYLSPGESVEGEATIQDIPIFKEKIIDNTIPPGKYSINLSFFQLMSNTINVIIK